MQNLDFQSFWQYRQLDNFYFFHYADLKRDLRANVRRIADILHIEISEKRVEEICEAASFAEMKKNASSFIPASGKGHFRSDELFFRSGKNEQWQDVLLADDIERYEVRIRELLPAAEIEWVEHGSS